MSVLFKVKIPNLGETKFAVAQIQPQVIYANSVCEMFIYKGNIKHIHKWSD